MLTWSLRKTVLGVTLVLLSLGIVIAGAATAEAWTTGVTVNLPDSNLAGATASYSAFASSSNNESVTRVEFEFLQSGVGLDGVSADTVAVTHGGNPVTPTSVVVDQVARTVTVNMVTSSNGNEAARRILVTVGGVVNPAAGTYRCDVSMTGNTTVSGFRTYSITGNSAPVARDDTYQTDEDTGLAVVAANGVLANDTDLNSDPLSAVLAADVDPAQGTLVFNPDGSFIFTPAYNFSGPATFTYRTYDGMLYSNTAMVTINVNPVDDPPVLDPIGDKDATEGAELAFTVTASDADLPAQPLAFSLTDAPAAAAIDPVTGAFSWTPSEADGPGAYDVTVTVSDGELTDAETFTITVAEVNTAPVATPDGYDTPEDVELVVLAPGVLANDTDADGNALHAVEVSGPQHGTLELNEDGSFSYTPALHYSGPDSFTYKASDGSYDSDVVAVSITVESVNQPPAATDDSYTTFKGTSISVVAPGVLGNDTDADDDTLVAVKVSEPSHGSLTLNSNGSFTYTPSAGFVGQDTFTYVASDGTASSAPATVFIEVTSALEDQAAGVTFDRWVSSYSPEWSGGSYVYGRWTDTQLEAKFVGSKIRWIGPRQPDYGMADVYIDGVLQGTVDCYLETGVHEAVVWESGLLAEGVHTLTIRLTGAKNPASTGNFVVIDKFELEGDDAGPVGTRLDEQGPNASYGGSWFRLGNVAYFNKGYSYTRWSGTYYKTLFNGTKIAWIGPRTVDYGYARIYIDNVYITTIDTYSATTGWRYKVWESGVLPRGQHALVIRPTGTKNPASANTIVVTDCFDVTP